MLKYYYSSSFAIGVDMNEDVNETFPNKLNAFYPSFESTKHLPIYLTGIGTSDPEYRVVRKQGLISHQFLITKRGSGCLKVGNEILPLDEGSCLYMPPKIPHEYYPVSEYWETRWLVFRGEYIDEIMKNLGFHGFLVHKPFSLDRILNLFNRLLVTAKGISYDAQKSSSIIYECILEAKTLLLDEENENSFTNHIIKPVIDFINANYSKFITLEELSNLIGVSQQHFCRVFKREMNMRPMAYLTKVRVFEAKQKLYFTDMQILEIAKSVGFESATYFSLVFKKHEGITPSEFRNSRNAVII